MMLLSSQHNICARIHPIYIYLRETIIGTISDLFT